MPTTIQLRPIKPKQLKVDRIRLELLNELRAQGQQHQKLLRQTVATWKGDKPTFRSHISLAGGDATVATVPEGSDLAINKWMWLDRGTRTRWALMSPDWKSKTKVGRFRSGGGRGRVLFFGKKAFRRRRMKARPGIEARGWTEKVMKDRDKPFEQGIAAAVERGADRAWE